MRYLLLFLGAVMLGTLTVSGQDADEDRALRDQIERLTALLRERARRNRRPREGTPVRKFYEVGDLTLRRSDVLLDETNLGCVDLKSKKKSHGGPVATFEIDQLIELVQTTCEPETWDAVEGAEIMPINNRLVVFNLPFVHRKIRRLLDKCRERNDREVSVEIVAVPVRDGDDGLLGGDGRVLSDEAVRQFLDRKPLGVVRLVAHDGQVAVQKAGQSVAYLYDYDVKVSKLAKVGDPIRREIFDGFAAQVRPCLDDGAKGVLLDCRLQLTEVLNPIPRHMTEHGEVELPIMKLTRVNTSFWAPLGKTVVAGGCTVGPDPVLLLVTARRLG
jgi:hypothetical protein